MTFVNEEELKKQNKLVKDYLNNRKLLRQKLQKESLAEQQLQKSASEIILPITKKLKKFNRRLMKDEKN